VDDLEDNQRGPGVPRRWNLLAHHSPAHEG
jgi:hypothetical protein